MATISETIDPSLSGIAWQIEMLRPGISRAQLILQAKRQFARECKMTTSKRIHRHSLDVSSQVESIDLPCDEVSILGGIISAELLESTVAKCREVSRDLVDSALELLQDGTADRIGEFPTSRAASRAGIPERTAVRRLQEMRALCAQFSE